ncbi:MAG: helix-turn-helix domain-containing protein [Candidatus Omnitrophica bacterium]|nr:helix-turn-helix domain-containing protein [Candidatus Omnitrophota bacterium]MCM8826172.1 helix-turn-helix domain-containing protein [Candidatus Omnitrophota bacterium]
MQYYHLIKDMSKMKFNLRLKMVPKAKQTSISEASRFYGMTRKTIRKWIERYEKEGLEGLKERKITPKNIPHKLSKEAKGRIIALRQRHPSWRPLRLLERYHVEGSNG